MRILFAVLVALVVAASGCRRACETADNCKRTCECVDTTTNTQLDCTMGFRCESATLECEAAYDEQACADVCNQYAAVGQCGFQRCLVDSECVRISTCPVLNADGNPSGLTFSCTNNFTCDTALELCSPGSELPLDALCFATFADGTPRCPQPVGG